MREAWEINAMRRCSKCGSFMVDAGMFDPEGTIPLVMETEENSRVWACLSCSANIPQETNRNGVDG